MTLGGRVRIQNFGKDRVCTFAQAQWYQYVILLYLQDIWIYVFTQYDSGNEVEPGTSILIYVFTQYVSG